MALSGPKQIDVAISQSSFHSPLVAWLLGVRSIYMNDNEHAMGNIPSFLFASKIMVPEFLAAEKLRKQWANPRKVVNYPGVKEGIYLWELDERLRQAGTDPNAKRGPPSTFGPSRGQRSTTRAAAIFSMI